MKTFLSIVVPTHKRPELFLNCIAYLANQDYAREDYEVIAVHDGLESDYDDKKIGEITKRIKSFKFEKVPLGGVARARNRFHGMERFRPRPRRKVTILV